ncbi:MAG TPA: hypothetical protein VN698_16410 [Bacteroidia bacterium]|nr:hypothetical protein [Bacteroidia bacterium]
MIPPTELRIGNLVYEEGDQLTEIINGWQMDEGMELFPVPLTEEILLKCGFEKLGIEDDDIFYRILIKFPWGGHVILHCNFGDPNEEFSLWSYPYIKSLHQLQNLYFALKGEELTIKQDA